NGGANGAAAINTPTGGAGGYTYNWIPGNPVGDGTVSVTGLAAGSWTVQVTDANSCTASQAFTVTQPTAISVTPSSQTNVSCNGGANGAAAINTPTGGAGGYTYNWIPGNPVGDGTVSVTGLAAGSWTVQVTDANSCTASQAFTVTQPTAINSSVISLTNVYCNGGTNGAASINATGGAGSYTYSWAPSGGNAAMASGLAAGSYTVTIQDANACTKTQNVTITQPTALAATTSFTNATCSAADGSASISVSGGTPSYTYSWAPSGGTGATASGLSAGTYTVTATDANTCQISRTVTVGTTINLVVTPSQTNVSCNGGSNGTATVSVTGGSTPYTYSWGPSGGTNATASGLAAGTYTVTITDNVACQTTQTFTLTQPAIITGGTAVTTVSCFGGANGTIDLTATGGTGAYTFVWSNGATTEDVIGLVAGSYSVTVTDANACTASFSTTVSQPTVLALSNSVTNSLCSGLSNGSIDLTVSGGTAAYTYLWSNTATTQDISGLADGTYTVTVTDANGCTATASATVQSPVAVSTTTTVTNVNCNGGNNGKVVLNPTGGTTPYTYAWSTGATIDSIVNRTAGSYSYTVTDANSCNVIGTVSITQPTMLAINTTVTANVLCYGESTGAIDATVTGGVTPYTYNWSNGTHNEDLTNAPAGSYTLAVIDANNCQISKGAGTVTQPATALFFVLDSTKDVNCNGATTGSIYTTVSGGTSPYSIVWSNGSTADDATDLAAGSYSVTVTDDNGCSASVSATLTQPTLLTFDTTVTNISCYGASTGSIDVEVAGGTFPYQFAWSNASINEDLSNLVAGSYSLTITDGAGCTLPTGPIVVSQSPNFGGTLDSLKNVTCFGLSNGAIYLTAAGATPPYTYLWSNGATTDDIVNVTAGAYVLTITDALGCNFNTPPFQVAQPSAPLAVAVTTANSLTCNGAANGSINITVTGGTASYMYMWSNGAITEDVVGLTAGAYQVTVTDVNGCTAVSQSVTLTEPSTLAGGIVTQAASCNGTATGTANLTVSGGTTAYSFVWSNGAITEDVAGLVAGTYTVTITDANNCSVSVSATVTEPALLVAIAVPTNALCNAANGSVDLTVTGGTQPYGYNWSNSTTAEDLASVAAGTYSVTVNDNNGCIANTSVTVTQPTAIAITNAVLDVACNGGADGEIDIEVSGGTGAYSYAWSTSDNTQDVAGLTEGSYAVTVSDANSCTTSATFTVAEPTALTLSTVADDASCNGGTDGAIDLTVTGGTNPYSYIWSNAATTQDVTGLNAGTYTVTVTDDNSCVNIVSVTVSEPTALALNSQVTHVQCFAGNNGAIDLTVSGGTASYTYVWSNAATTEDITGLVANTYNVTVTDANTCSASAAIIVGEPTLLIASAVASPALCNGGTGLVDVTVTGGAPAYTFVWSNAATTEDINDVAGAYTVTVTDNRQCTATATATVSQPSAITVQTQVTNATCPGGANGVVDITVAGGTGAYTYVWSNGTTMQDSSGLTAGTYSVTVTDANGCIATASATVNEPAAIAATANVQDVTCNGTGDGSITVSVSGGTGSYAYAWSNGANTANIGGLAGGAYTLTITDYNLCTAVFGPYTVVEPLPIVAALDSFDAVSCFGTSTGNVYVTVAGGTTPYTFAWSNGATTEDLIGVPAGIYTGTVTDANGCQFTSPQIPVTQPASAVAVAITTVNDVTCNGLANGEVMVSATGGTSPYTYAWSNNGTGDMIMGVVADIYTVSVTDANGCSVSVSATVNEPAVLTASATGTDVSCEGGSNGTVAVTTTGGTTPYTAVWSSGATTGLVVGTYDVTVTDANQCSTTATVDLTFTNTNPVVDLGADVTQCGGTVTLDAGIANANYAWSNGGTAQTTVVGASTSYSVTVTTTAGCTGADTVQVTINAIPQVSFNVADTVCLNASPITLTANPAGGTFAGTLVSGDVFTPSAAGEQAVTYTYTDANNCSASASDTIVVNVCVGIEDIALATKLSVYPVPNTGAFTVAGSSFVSCQLTNNLGQALQYFDLNADNNYTYGVQNLSAGVYYVIATNGNASATYKVLVIE
ncbi:MAG: T9SS type A sorting domain-containing protein, partial [Bacteroidetes bacterium]|nr:T9SS type A sorting domain-containing protein [Bacteroidota bacterium]